MMFRTSSSKPRSIILSASSMQRYLQLLNVNRFFSSISIKRPGVAITMWSPLLSTWLWSFIDIPPMHSSAFNCGYLPSFAKDAHQVTTLSYVWVANSRDGHRMIPTGPSPRTRGSFISSSRAIIISGRQNARVFPEPVKAIPMISRPEKLKNLLWSPGPAHKELTRLEFLATEWGSGWRYVLNAGTPKWVPESSYPIIPFSIHIIS